MSEIRTVMLESGPPGSQQQLELLMALPETQSAADRPPIMFLHGAYCSAWDYQNFLPYFASRGYPAYAMSLRGHGKSWSPAPWRLQLLTTMDHHLADIKVVLQHISQQHPASPLPVLCGHSFGGGYLQYLLSQETKLSDTTPKLASGLVLLGAAPIWGGGKQIMANWEQVETKGKGYAYPWSPRSQLDTAEQVRDAFFSPDTGAEAIEQWRNTCRTEKEGIRAGLAAFWPFGEAADVMAAIEGFGDSQSPRRVHLVAAQEDALVTVDLVRETFDKYQAAVAANDQQVTQVVIPGSGHHMMMDKAWKGCADDILEWLAC